MTEQKNALKIRLSLVLDLKKSNSIFMAWLLTPPSTTRTLRIKYSWRPYKNAASYSPGNPTQKKKKSWPWPLPSRLAAGFGGGGGGGGSQIWLVGNTSRIKGGEHHPQFGRPVVAFKMKKELRGPLEFLHDYHNIGGWFIFVTQNKSHIFLKKTPEVIFE